MRPRVVVGLSGGVDSSVAAYILQQQGYEVHGVYMQNWHGTEGLLKGDCPFEEDSRFAAMVAKKLGFPFEIVDLSEAYRLRVIDYLFREYAQGRTPNPDVLCNREIKFAAFWQFAQQLGAEYVATGHYVRKATERIGNTVRYRLLAGVDTAKDQSYFLCQVSQEQLAHALFPIGGMRKGEVRALARRLGLATAARKDSYGICFVGKIDLPTFLAQRLAPCEGPVIEIPRSVELPPTPEDLPLRARPYALSPSMGVRVGTHRGAHFYTVGQRKGLGIGGKALPLFVLGVDVAQNALYVGQGHDHPLLSRRVVYLHRDGVHWIDPDSALGVGEARAVQARLRYRQPLQPAVLYARDEGVYIEFEALQRGVTAGQFAVWYDGERLLGSGAVFS